ncbi:hypothetical protein [Hymenobacter busanensis]|uniref:hypothetical protein n=1 Tax=Hymenobacter busanensis TaxID=2607656 RepID=UPI001366EB4D|nr:hypothetical protein [Hymenobacter busanensis]QHJ05933.1 hypothetical protein GUY19_00945 [Hymenobacter busanensis]QHJ07180.1 hypothetical protein GUY19_07750 [Hymenobacter busanensis]QHJ08836.1 hypothetical protein GUY19_16695 [Hymenobacter busanensis]
MLKSKEISLPVIAQTLQRVLARQLSREAAADWAAQVCTELEAERLTYNPAKAERQIWAALDYVRGIDLQDAPGSYLHDEENLRNYLKDIS